MSDNFDCFKLHAENINAEEVMRLARIEMKDKKDKAWTNEEKLPYYILATEHMLKGFRSSESKLIKKFNKQFNEENPVTSELFSKLKVGDMVNVTFKFPDRIDKMEVMSEPYININDIETVQLKHTDGTNGSVNIPLSRVYLLDEKSDEIDFKASELFAERLLNGESFKNIIEARKALTTKSIKAGTEDTKKADEAMELAGVLAARRIIDKGLSESDTFDELAKIADQLPSLNSRTSESMNEQAYSTPLLLAYVASTRAGITKTTNVLESTAGNGALVMAANPRKVVANELNKSRLKNLKEQGFDAINHDAATYDFEGEEKKFDVVIVNPPFGAVYENGNVKTFRINERYSTNEIDHVISINSLQSMKDDGKAVLIVGSINPMLSDENKSDAYNGRAKRAFYKTIYDNYNVTDHFTVDGNLYAKQGTKWPVDVIIIDGKGKSSMALPAVNLPRIIKTTEELKNELDTNRRSLSEGTKATGQDDGIGTTENNEDSTVGTGEGRSSGADKNDNPTSVLPGSGGKSKINGDDANDNTGQDKRGDGRTGSDNGNDTVLNKFSQYDVKKHNVTVMADGSIFKDGFETGLILEFDGNGIRVSRESDNDTRFSSSNSSPSSFASFINSEYKSDKPKNKSEQDNSKENLNTDLLNKANSLLKNRHITPSQKTLLQDGIQKLSEGDFLVPGSSRFMLDRDIPVIERFIAEKEQSANNKEKSEQEIADSLSDDEFEGLDEELSRLGDIIGDVFNLKLNATGTKFSRSDLLVSLSKILEIVISKGIKSFKAAVKRAVKAMRNNASLAGIMDNITPRQWKAAYNSIAEYTEGTDSEELVNSLSNDDVNAIINEDTAKKEEEINDNAFQVKYNPLSSLQSVGTLIPINMKDATEQALANLKEKHGDVDDYVAKLLDYKRDDLGKYFSAEQVDAIGLALDSIENGKGFIVGDQTGVGKGRINAAMIRYAMLNNITPIFVTQTENLYGDMIRDLQDIGMPDAQPFPTNNNCNIPLDADAQHWYNSMLAAKENKEKIPAKYGKFISSRNNKVQDKLIQDMTEEGSIGDNDVIFTTYSQMQTFSSRLAFLKKLGKGALLILDESHNAGGVKKEQSGSNTAVGMIQDAIDAGEIKGVGGRAQVVRDLVAKAKGVFYSSATYAKRPDVLDLYSKTDMGMVANPKSLIEALKSGGVPLQQAVASMLAKTGQYIRREKSFDGIVYDTTVAEVDRDFAENAAEIMRDIMTFDKLKKKAVQKLSNDLKAEAATITEDRSAGMAGADSVNFASSMHNMISQMLLILKVQPTINEALAALDRDEKPVIALSNTMGSAIGDYVKDHGLLPGDEIGVNFGNLLKRYLEKSKMVTERDAFGATDKRELTDEELGQAATKFYNKILSKINSKGFDKYPVSPIDAIHDALHKKGYKTGEITGRDSTIDYSGKVPVFRKRSIDAIKPAGKRKTVNDFNNGVIDVLILNQSGATGLSLHASPKVGSDTRKRLMIIAQAELNIDTHMQMLGRINRTGQINNPAYMQLVANIPAEKRPAAILSKKMSMLNAQTTAGKDSVVKAKDVADFMNEYGDEIAALIMSENRDLHDKLGSPLNSETSSNGDIGFSKEDAIRKVTGRIPVLKLEQQEHLYSLIEEAYNEYIDMLNKTGQNNLEAGAMALDAKTTKSTPVVHRVSNDKSPFAEGVNAESVNVKRIGKPFTLDQVYSLIAKNGVTNDESQVKFVDSINKRLRTEKELALNLIDKLPEEYAEEIVKKQSAIYQVNLRSSYISEFTESFRPGKSVSLISPQGIEYLGFISNLERKGDAKNYFALSNWKLTILVADSAKQFVLPLSKIVESSAAIEGSWTITSSIISDVKDAFEEGATSSREDRIILTGNMLAAYTFNKTGRIINYTNDSGSVNQGVLMPKKFDLDKAINAKPVIFGTPELALEYLNKSRNPINALKSSDNSVRIMPQYNGHYKLYIPSAKTKNKAYLSNDDLLYSVAYNMFVKSGKEMVATVYSDNIEKVLNILYPIVQEFQPVSKDTGKAFLEEKGIKYSKKEQDGEDFALTALRELAKEDEFFRLPISHNKTIEGVFKEIIPQFIYRGFNEDKHRHLFAMQNGRHFYVYQQDGKVWLDVSKLQTGDGGSSIYFATGNYAYNTGEKFIGDPEGLTPDAIVRRTANMLSLSLRFGSTDFLGSSKEQAVGIQAEGIIPLKWKGTNEDKVKSLIKTFLSNLHNQFPEIKHARFDFNTGDFRDSNNMPIPFGAFNGINGGKFQESARKARAGTTTTRQGILIQSLISSKGSERPDILGQLLHRSSELVKVGGSLSKTFSKSSSQVTNPHTESSLLKSMRDVMDKKFGSGWTQRLMNTGKIKIINSEEAKEYIDNNAKYALVGDRSAANTQIDTTMGAYSAVARNIFAKIPGVKNILDYGAGKGRGTASIQRMLNNNGLNVNTESYEPFPENWSGALSDTPDYTDADLIKDGSKDAIVNLNVLNVVPKEIRDDIVKNIGRILKDGGIGVISSRRWKGDVDTIKPENSKPGDEPNSYYITRKLKGAIQTNYQKGIEPDELLEYVKHLLPGFDVRKINGYGASAVIIQKPGGTPLIDSILKSEKKESNGSGYSETASLRKEAKDLGAGERYSAFGVGKKMGDEVYLHRDYEGVIPAGDLADAKSRIKGFKYNLIRYNTKTGSIGFFNSPDFNSSDEPVNGDLMVIEPDGRIRSVPLNKNADKQAIYHHKWQWVKDDYTGFNVKDSIKRSIAWQRVVNKEGIDRKRIGFQGVWQNEVISQFDIKYSKDGKAQAFYNPSNNTTYLISDNISSDDINGLLLHEIADHALQLGKTNAEYADILKQLNKLKDTDSVVKDAFNRVPKDTNPDDVMSEVAAYLVQNNPNLSISKRIIAWVREALRSIGKSLGIKDKVAWNKWANELSVNDIVFMANKALKSAPETLNSSNLSKDIGNTNKELKDQINALKSFIKCIAA